MNFCSKWGILKIHLKYFLLNCKFFMFQVRRAHSDMAKITTFTTLCSLDIVITEFMISIFKKNCFKAHLNIYTSIQSDLLCIQVVLRYSHEHASKSDMEEKKWLNKVVILVFFVHKKYSHSIIE